MGAYTRGDLSKSRRSNMGRLFRSGGGGKLRIMVLAKGLSCGIKPIKGIISSIVKKENYDNLRHVLHLQTLRTRSDSMLRVIYTFGSTTTFQKMVLC